MHHLIQNIAIGIIIIIVIIVTNICKGLLVDLLKGTLVEQINARNELIIVFD